MNERLWLALAIAAQVGAKIGNDFVSIGRIDTDGNFWTPERRASAPPTDAVAILWKDDTGRISYIAIAVHDDEIEKNDLRNDEERTDRYLKARVANAYDTYRSIIESGVTA